MRALSEAELAALERVRRTARKAADALEKKATAQAKSSKALARLTDQKWRSQMADLGIVRRLLEELGVQTQDDD